MTLSQMFRLTSARSVSLESELPIRGKPFFPGLPDDLTLHHLLRIPVDKHASYKTVCKRWYSLFGNKEEFFTLRKEFGFHDPWLYVCAHHKRSNKIVWNVLDLTQFSWHTIPPMPCDENISPKGFRCVSIPHKGVLFVIGGVVPDVDRPLDTVLKYEVCKNSWTVMNNKMITARSSFASGLIDGMIYIAGGYNTEQIMLDSAEAMDPEKGTWHPVADMGENMKSYDAAVLNGKLLVTEGYFWPLSLGPRGSVYDPVTDNWENMTAGLRDRWTGSSVVMHGHLFVVLEHEGTKVKVYHGKTDSWEFIEGSWLPDQIRKPFCVNCWSSNIYVVGRGLHVAVGHVTRLEPSGASDEKCRFSVEWEMVDAPDTLSELTSISAHVLFAWVLVIVVVV